MVELSSPKLNSLVCFGAYGEKAIPNVFQNHFHKSTCLLCFLHLKEHNFTKLKVIGITLHMEKEFIKETIGDQDG